MKAATGNKEVLCQRSTEAKRTAIVVAQEFEDVELLYPVIRSSEEGAEISLVPVQEGLHTRSVPDKKPVTGFAAGLLLV